MPRYETAVVIPAYNEEKEIGRSLLHLATVQPAGAETVPVVVVDNGSSDKTREVVEENRIFRELEIHLVDEPQKGTGSAVDTGFCYAIDELGAKVIARLDADTWPLPSWLPTLKSHHKQHTNTQLLSGPAFRRLDALERPRDIYLEDLIIPAAKRLTRLARIAKYRNPAFVRFAPGYNMSTTRRAYLETGGFPRSSMNEIDEDVAYNLLVAQKFGSRAIRFERTMQVEVSARRQLSAGYIKAALHYASTKNRSVGQVDIR
ncbi:MAG TPA: glycosyltransferase family A protein [Candidatus Saccharimonadales bacterium]|nr:glycosyltransferase family A protein [Candidatus Saccharimonadales bacterium]